MINLPSEFEVCISTRYKNVKGNEKCTNAGGLGHLGSLKPQGTANSTV